MVGEPACVIERLPEHVPTLAQQSLEEEYGDLLFTLVNWGRLPGVHPDAALRRANRKFESRFRRLESLAAQRGPHARQPALETLDALWDEVKELERA